MSNLEDIPRNHETPHRSENAKCTVPMLGSEFCFSDGLIKTLCAEFESVTFERGSDLSEISRICENHCHVPFLLVDQDQIATQYDMLAAARAARTEMLVLAYGGHPPDQELLRQRLDEYDPPRIGLLPLNMRIDVLLAVMRLLLCGEILVPEAILRRLMAKQPGARPRAGAADPVTHDLTRREWEVLALIAEGKQNKIVAAELGLSEHTVKLHIHHLISKLGVSNRTSAAIWFLANVEGSVTPSDTP